MSDNINFELKLYYNNSYVIYIFLNEGQCIGSVYDERLDEPNITAFLSSNRFTAPKSATINEAYAMFKNSKTFLKYHLLDEKA